MPRPEPTQLRVFSTFARARAREIAEATGMTLIQVVEAALRAYSPPTGVGRLVRRGPVLVVSSGNRAVTLDEAQKAPCAAREDRP